MKRDEPDGCFDLIPVPLFIQELIPVVQGLGALEQEGHSMAEAREHPEILKQFWAETSTIHLNQAAREFMEAEGSDACLGRFLEQVSADVLARLSEVVLRHTPTFCDEIGVCSEGDNARLFDVRFRRLDDNRAVFSVVELSDRAGLRKSLEQTRTELHKIDQDLAQFAYVTSHDLQEPLRMVTSYAQLFAKRYGEGLDERGDKYLHYITDGAKRMQGLVSALLSWSRVGTQGKPMQPCNGEEVLAQALIKLRSKLVDAGAEVTHGTLPTVWADRVQLIQLFQQLIDNAIKFRSEAPPRIHISSKPRSDRPQSDRPQPDRPQPDRWVIEVRDNGIGMESRHHEEVFTIFRRLHVRGTYPGIGIGLALCKRIVERHAGQIWLRSAPHEGTTVCFSLPRDIDP